MNMMFKYLDDVLVQSKFKFDVFKSGVSVIQSKFPELKNRREAVQVVRDWVIDTDPYNRLAQPGLFN